MPTLTVADFAWSFGITPEDMPKKCCELINSKDFSYRIISGGGDDSEILEALKRINNNTKIVATPERTAVWENGWNENLQEFIDNEYDVNCLMPKYYHPHNVMRWKQKFIRAENPNFQVDFESVAMNYVFESYFAPYDTIYEFGCGSCHKLMTLAELYPDKTLYGLDFTQSAVNIVNLLAQKKKLSLYGRKFDMIHPDYDLKLKPNSAVYTWDSIEQLDSKYEEFLQYLLSNRPSLCVHVEPSHEFYEQDNLVDYLAYMFHIKRHYPYGFLSRIKQLEQDEKISIIKVNRSYFGDQNNESVNFIIYKII